MGALGALVLIAYGVIPTFQPEGNFGRIYAAYGGVFVVMSTFWGWWVDGKALDLWDWVGAEACVAGVGIIMWAPR